MNYLLLVDTGCGWRRWSGGDSSGMHTHSLWWSGYSQRIHRLGLRDPHTSACACLCLFRVGRLLRKVTLHIACTYVSLVLYVLFVDLCTEVMLCCTIILLTWFLKHMCRRETDRKKERAREKKKEGELTLVESTNFALGHVLIGCNPTHLTLIFKCLLNTLINVWFD